MPCLRHYGGMRVTPMAMLGNLPVLCIDRHPMLPDRIERVKDLVRVWSSLDVFDEGYVGSGRKHESEYLVGCRKYVVDGVLCAVDHLNVLHRRVRDFLGDAITSARAGYRAMPPASNEGSSLYAVWPVHVGGPS